MSAAISPERSLCWWWDEKGQIIIRVREGNTVCRGHVALETHNIKCNNGAMENDEGIVRGYSNILRDGLKT